MPNAPTKKHLRALVEACFVLRETGDPSAAAAALEVPEPAAPVHRAPPAPARAVSAFRRDGFCCRYCGTRIVPVAVLRAAALAFPDALTPDASRRLESHPAYTSSAAVLDVVDPLDAEPDALAVTACLGCSAQKGVLSLKRLGWKLRVPQESEWDGLVSAYELLLLHRRGRVLSAADRNFHVRWLRAFELDVDVLKRWEGSVADAA